MPENEQSALNISEGELLELVETIDLLRVKMKCLEAFSCGLQDSAEYAAGWLRNFASDAQNLLSHCKSSLS